MQALKNVINRMSRKPEPEIFLVQTSDDGLEVTWEDGRAEAMKWSEVDRVVTYKVDCFTYDMIWLAFERRGHDESDGDVRLGDAAMADGRAADDGDSGGGNGGGVGRRRPAASACARRAITQTKTRGQAQSGYASSLSLAGARSDAKLLLTAR